MSPPAPDLYTPLTLKLGSALITTAITFWLPVSQTGAATIEDSRQEVRSEHSPLTISGRLGPGYLRGEAHEYVYWPEEGGRTASELCWKINSVAMFGVGASIQPLNRLTINTDFWFNLGEGDAHLTDYDWLEKGKDWTHRSMHDNTDLTKAVIYDINMEVTIFSTGTVSFTGIAGYRHDTFEWEARGGSYIYSKNGYRDSIGTFPPNVLGITYEQRLHVPYLGMGCKADFDRIQLAAQVTGSTIAGGQSTDHHHRHNFIVNDDFGNETIWWALRLHLAYSINDSIAITGSYSYEKYETMKGDSEWNYDDEGAIDVYPDSSGAELKTSLLLLDLSYRF